MNHKTYHSNALHLQAIQYHYHNHHPHYCPQPQYLYTSVIKTNYVPVQHWFVPSILLGSTLVYITRFYERLSLLISDNRTLAIELSADAAWAISTTIYVPVSYPSPIATAGYIHIEPPWVAIHSIRGIAHPTPYGNLRFRVECGDHIARQGRVVLQGHYVVG